LFSLQDLTEEHHTGEKLAEEIINVINKIGGNKFTAIVTDNGANVAKSREIVSSQYPKILNIRCITHCFNLITHDILNHSFANKIIRYCNTLVNYFKKSHICGSLLEKLICEKKIIGGGLKNYVKTRWITMSECTESILRLKSCFLEVNESFIFKIYIILNYLLNNNYY
jgi:Protein of unknown function (DUF 659)